MTLNPRDLIPIRVLLRTAETPYSVPSTAVEEDGTQKTYFGELGINRWDPEDLSYSGIFIRVGNETLESPGDKIVRIGRAFVSNLDPTDPPGTPTAPENLSFEGELWYRPQDKAFFIHDGQAWQQLTSQQATQNLRGIIQIASSSVVLAGVDNSQAVTPQGLEVWKNARGLLQAKRPAQYFYVDPQAGTDVLENSGTDQYRPFRSIERALLEVARRGSMDQSTIELFPGVYNVDNGPGVLVKELPNLLGTGPIFRAPTGLTLVQRVPGSPERFEVSGTLVASVLPGDEIFNTQGGRAEVLSVALPNLTVQTISGTWAAGDSIQAGRLRLFNPPEGGCVVPKGCSIVSKDLRKVKFRPRYLGSFDLWNQSLCQYIGRTALLKLTAGSFVSGVTFEDSGTLATHHLCSAVEFVSEVELSSGEYGYYPKVQATFSALDNKTYQVSAEEYIVTASTEIGDSAETIDEVTGSSPYLLNCSVRTEWGLCGPLANGAKVSGYRSMVLCRYSYVGYQRDSAAFNEDKTFRAGWRPWGVKGIQDGYLIVNTAVVVGGADQYAVESGAEMSLSGSTSNFGSIGLKASGSKSIPFPQDTGLVWTGIVPPAPLPTTPTDVAIGAFLGSGSTATKLYIEGEISEAAIAPYRFVGDDTLVVTAAQEVQYTAKLRSTAPFYAQDEGGYFFIVQSTNNQIFAQVGALDGLTVSIQRVQDKRRPDERIFWLYCSGVSQTTRIPPVGFNLIPDRSSGAQFSNTYLILKSTDQNPDGSSLPQGFCKLAIVIANGVNPTLQDLYPRVIWDSPESNPSESLTFQALQGLARDLNWSLPTQEALLDSGSSVKSIPAAVGVSSLRPSTLRATAHTWEWVGLRTPSKGLPQFIQGSWDSSPYLTAAHGGGMVVAQGVDETGRMFVLNESLEIESDASQTLPEPPEVTAKTFSRAIVLESLKVVPGATLDLRSAELAFDTQSSLGTVDPDSGVMATSGRPGFVRLAAPQDLTDPNSSAVVTAPNLVSSVGAVQESLDAQVALTSANFNLLNLQAQVIAPGVANVRLSVEQTNAFSQANVPTTVEVWLHPWGGGAIGLLGTSGWSLQRVLTPVRINLAPCTDPNKNYDVYCGWVSGAFTFTFAPWPDDATPPTRSVVADVLVQPVTFNRLIGVVRTTAPSVTSQILSVQDGSSGLSAFCSSLYNQKPVGVTLVPFTSGYTFAPGTAARRVGGFATSRVSWVQSSTSGLVDLSAVQTVTAAASGQASYTLTWGLGDLTPSNLATPGTVVTPDTVTSQVHSTLRVPSPGGFNTANLLESSGSGGGLVGATIAANTGPNPGQKVTGFIWI